jgi:hypothetical protein
MDALRVVINCDGELAFGGFLTDHVLIEKIFDLQRLGNFVGACGGRFRLVVLKDRVTNRYAFIADVCPRVIARRGDELTNYVLAFMTEGTSKCVVRTSALQELLLPLMARM